ncbi:MAG: TRAP transporter large permease subunit, partial [Actinomycetia bacterium]|nr:TRAP transporter large permease subunit [Actinomycetes bacterium]
MTPFEVGLAGLGALLVLLFWGVPVGITMGIVGFVGFAAISGLQPALGMIRIVPFSTFSSYTLSVIPLFILMGNFAYHGGLSGDLYNTARQFLGRMRGGLAMSTVAACAAFAACSGSSIATAATMGKIALPEMKRYGYDDTLRLGCVAAGGTIGVLIPPSVILILYGICTSESIGKLFMAGFIPGILQALFYIVTIYLICRLNPAKGPAGPKTTW